MMRNSVVVWLFGYSVKIWLLQSFLSIFFFIKSILVNVDTRKLIFIALQYHYNSSIMSLIYYIQ